MKLLLEFDPPGWQTPLEQVLWRLASYRLFILLPHSFGCRFSLSQFGRLVSAFTSILNRRISY